MGTTRRLSGGLLSGLGAGLANRHATEVKTNEARLERAHEVAAEMRRQAGIQEENRLDREHDAAVRKDEREHDERLRTGERADRIAAETAERVSRENQSRAEREADASQIADTIVGEDGEVFGVTRGGQSRGLGFKAAPTRSGSSADDSGLSAGEQRAIDTAREAATTPGRNPEDAPIVNYQEARRILASRPETKHLVDWVGGTSQPGTDVESPEYRRAEKMADEWIGNQAGWFSTDSTDFKDFGGNRTDARAAKVDEFYQQITGRGQPANRAPQEPQSAAAGQLPEGIPPNSKLVGYKNGAEVYLAPDGKRYLAE